MKISVLGTGMVGRALAARLAGLGHDVVIGTRDPGATLARADADAMGTVPFAEWHRDHTDIELVAYPAAGSFADVVVNATNGANSVAALQSVGAENLAGKVILDLGIPLDLSRGFPPALVEANTDSLGEQIQAAFPGAKVVKSLHTVYFEVMIDPSRVPGTHSIFVGGNDSDAKHLVTGILEEFGWPVDSILDLGDITSARATEMYSRLFFALYGQFGRFDFNINVVRA